MRFVSNMMQRSLCANIISSVHLEPDAKVSCANMTFSKRFVLNKMQRSLVLTPQSPLGDLSCIQSKSCANIISPMRRFVPTMQRPLVNCKMQRKTSQVWKKMGKQRGDQKLGFVAYLASFYCRFLHACVAVAAVSASASLSPCLAPSALKISYRFWCTVAMSYAESTQLH